MVKRSDASNDYESMMQRVRDRANALRSSPEFDPRKEHEIDDLYNQYIPPYATQGNDSLIDIAERDAYINGNPPLGSQKKGGIVIKKTIRTAIGWYMQFVTQQISTFGSGVARALRSMNSDIEDLKKSIGSSSENNFVYSLNLVPRSKELLPILEKRLTNSGPIIITDSLDSPTVEGLRERMQVIVIDANSESAEFLDSSIDVRNETFSQFASASAHTKFSGAILSGRIECFDPGMRYVMVENATKLCDSGSRVGVVISARPNDDQLLACEILGTTMWSQSTWQKVLEFFLTDVTADDTGDGFIFISGSTRAAG